MGRPRTPIGAHGAINLRKVNGRWIADVRVRDLDGHTRQVRRVGRTRQIAQDAIEEALANRPGFGLGMSSQSPIVELAKAWLREVDDRVRDGGLSHGTARIYRLVTTKHIVPKIGHLPISDATIQALNHFIRTMRRSHEVALTRTARTCLKGMFAFAACNGLIRDDPMHTVARILGDQRRAPRSLTDDERLAWISALDHDPEAVRHDLPGLARFMLATGVRIGEALAVTFDDIDFDAATVAIDWKVERIRGRGLERTAPKTAAGHRTLPLPDWAIALLLERGDQLGWTGPVFPAIVTRKGGVYQRAGGGWRDPSNTANRLREARRRAGFGDWLTSHVFRKTVATTLLDVGIGERFVADQLGHASLRTLEHYIGRKTVGGDDTRAALSKLGC